MRRACLPVVLAASLVPALAHAHGKFPAPSGVAIDPADPDHLVARMTYGFMVTRDGGEVWEYLCPEAIGYDGDKLDPPFAIAGEALVVGLFDGLAVASDASCDWGRAGRTLEDKYFVDVEAETSAGHALALSSNGLGADTFEVHVFASEDGAASWQDLGGSPPEDFLALSVMSAPSDPQRLYLSGRDGTGSTDYTPVIYRSDDRGESWVRQPLPLAADEGILVTVVGIDPADSDVVYLTAFENEGLNVMRTDLLVTSDGGMTWSQEYGKDAPLLGFALSPDGSLLALGGISDGVLIGATADFDLQPVSDIGATCMRWTEDGLYSCANAFKDGFALGRSTDEGASFEGLLQLASPCGPPSCPSNSTVVTEMCAARWVAEQAELGVDPCGVEGTGGGGGAGGGAAGEPPGDDGCSCRSAGGAGGGAWAWLALLVPWWRRRRLVTRRVGGGEDRIRTGV